MAKGVDPRGGGSAMGISVYVLRDPRDGVVFFVGRTSDADAYPADEPNGIGSNQSDALERQRAIREAGHEVERVVVASNLATDPEALIVQRAVVAAYAAAKPTPTSLIGASAHHGHGSSGDAPQGGDPFDDPTVRQFVAQAAAEIDRLSSALGRAEQGLAGAASHGFLDADHRARLEGLILQQESEMAELNVVLNRVRALRDLGQWAAKADTHGDSGGTIRLSDLTRALDSRKIDDVFD